MFQAYEFSTGKIAIFLSFIFSQTVLKSGIQVMSVISIFSNSFAWKQAKLLYAQGTH
jgi:hypothetical protein